MAAWIAGPYLWCSFPVKTVFSVPRPLAIHVWHRYFKREPHAALHVQRRTRCSSHQRFKTVRGKIVSSLWCFSWLGRTCSRRSARLPHDRCDPRTREHVHGTWTAQPVSEKQKQPPRPHRVERGPTPLSTHPLLRPQWRFLEARVTLSLLRTNSLHIPWVSSGSPRKRCH